MFTGIVEETGSVTGVRPTAAGIRLTVRCRVVGRGLKLGDSVAVMDNGRVVHAGRMQALAEDTALQQSLLGLAL